MTNEFIIKINTDSRGNQVSLNSMPVEAADALKVFLESLTEFAKQHPNRDDVRLAVKDGCAETVMAYPSENSVIDNDIQEVIEGNSDSSEFVKFFNNIHEKIKSNGLDYSVTRNVNGERQDLTTVFKTKRFTKKRSNVIREEKVVFIQGHLLEAGGKGTPNMHIESGSEEFKVNFRREDAKYIPKLYEEIFLSALETEASNADKPSYDLIEQYPNKERFSFYKELYERIQGTNELERFDWVFDYIEENIQGERAGIGRIIKLMRLYKHAQGDRGVIRTILMTLKPVKDLNEDLEIIFNDLADILKSGKKTQII